LKRPILPDDNVVQLLVEVRQDVPNGGLTVEDLLQLLVLTGEQVFPVVARSSLDLGP
jgi:hypothetical protein